MKMRWKSSPVASHRSWLTQMFVWPWSLQLAGEVGSASARSRQDKEESGEREHEANEHRGDARGIGKGWIQPPTDTQRCTGRGC
jgi:hypothetical protein